ncbi:MAG: hypothetical protein ACLVIH_16775 [Paraclostridium sordellii]
MLLEVGKPIEGIEKRYNEGITFDITDNGANVIIKFDSPILEEIKAIKEEKIKYAYYMQGNVIFMLFKFGDLDWMDAPYSVHLSKNLTRFLEINDGQGLALNIHLVDAKTGILKVLRLVGLSNAFSKALIKDIEKQKEMSYEGYESTMNTIFRTYSTKELVKRAKANGWVK